ncbi:MAG: MATE family efflux transporter [Anaerolineae bacterium]
MLGSVAMGMGIGTSAVVSRAIGQGDPRRVQRLTTDSLSLAVVIVLLFVVIGLLTIEPVFTMLGATPDLMPLIQEYMVIWYGGMAFLVVPMVGNNAIRATGDTKTPSMVMLLAAGVNLVLDPIFIFGFGPIPRMELAGAAIATVLARAITFGVAIWVLHFRERMITFEIPPFKEGVASWGSILYVGVPAAGTNMIVPVGVGVVTSMLAGYGPAVVAGFGAASRIEIFAITVIMALGSVLSPFVGQNWGAGKLERVKTAIRYSQIFSMAWGAAMFLLFLPLAGPLAAAFSDDPQVVSAIQIYLWLVPISYGFQGMLTLSNSALNVLRKPLHAAALAVTRMFVLYVPLAYLGSMLFGVPGIFAAATVANIAAGAAAYLWLNRVLASGEMAASPAAKRPVVTAAEPAK